MRYRQQDENGDYPFIGNSPFLVDSPAGVAQAIKTRLTLKRTEWFLDLRVGLDHEAILGYDTQNTRDLELQQTISSTRGVTEIVSYFSEVTPDRKFLVTATVNTQYGPTTITEIL